MHIRRLFSVVPILVAVSLLTGAGCASTQTRGIGNEGFAVFEVEPSDAQVFLDGQLVGEARQYAGWNKVLVLQSGTHRIEIKKEGYTPFQKEIYASSGVKQTVRAKLTKAAQ